MFLAVRSNYPLCIWFLLLRLCEEVRIHLALEKRLPFFLNWWLSCAIYRQIYRRWILVSNLETSIFVIMIFKSFLLLFLNFGSSFEGSIWDETPIGCRGRCLWCTSRTHISQPCLLEQVWVALVHLDRIIFHKGRFFENTHGTFSSLFSQIILPTLFFAIDSTTTFPSSRRPQNTLNVPSLRIIILTSARIS